MMLVTVAHESQDHGRGVLGEVGEHCVDAEDQQDASGMTEPRVPPTEKEGYWCFNQHIPL